MKKLLATLIAGMFAMGTVSVSAQTPAPAPIAPAAPAAPASPAKGGDTAKADGGSKAEKRKARKAGKKAGKKGGKKAGKKKADGDSAAPAPAPK